MCNEKQLYLSISSYENPNHTIVRKVHTSLLWASEPKSLSCEVKENKYKYYQPVLVEVFELDFENNTITSISIDDMTPPTDSQLDIIKSMCADLQKSYNKPKTSVYASAWINHYMKEEV